MNTAPLLSYLVTRRDDQRDHACSVSVEFECVRRGQSQRRRNGGGRHKNERGSHNQSALGGTFQDDDPKTGSSPWRDKGCALRDGTVVGRECTRAPGMCSRGDQAYALCTARKCFALKQMGANSLSVNGSDVYRLHSDHNRPTKPNTIFAVFYTCTYAGSEIGCNIKNAFTR